MDGILYFQHGDQIINLTKLRTKMGTIVNPDVRRELSMRITALESVVHFLTTENEAA